MDEIEFKEPPPARTGSGRRSEKYVSIAEQLKARPNEMALILQDANSGIATMIKSGKLHAFRPAGAFKAMTRTTGKGKSDIYAMYIGEQAKE